MSKTSEGVLLQCSASNSSLNKKYLHACTLDHGPLVPYLALLGDAAGCLRLARLSPSSSPVRRQIDARQLLHPASLLLTIDASRIVYLSRSS